MENAAPIFEQQKNRRGSVSEAEVALMTWIQGALFNKDILPGHYHLKMDAINDYSDANFEEHKGEMIRALGNLPRRIEFAAERRVESAQQQFQEWMEPDLDQTKSMGLVCPAYIPLISPLQVPGQFMAGGTPIIPLSDAHVELQAFRAYAFNRLTFGLRAPIGNFREIKFNYLKAFDDLDRLYQRARASILQEAVVRFMDRTRKEATAHIQRQDNSRAELEQQHEAIDSAVAALETFVGARKGETIHMFSPPRIAADGEFKGGDKIGFKKAMALFEKPMFNVIRAVPVQVATGYLFNGDFPYNGCELFQKK